MKKISYLLLLLVAVLVMPFVYAEGEEETTTQDTRVPVYFFHGDGCPHCEEATEWFKSIDKDHSSKIKIIRYETWNNSDNSALMQKVAEFRNDEANGVPYIIIGDQSWIGFASDSMGPEILEKIDAVYQQPVGERYDAIYLANDGVIPAGDEGSEEPAKEEESKSNDVIALIIILAVVGAGCFGVYKARNTTN